MGSPSHYCGTRSRPLSGRGGGGSLRERAARVGRETREVGRPRRHGHRRHSLRTAARRRRRCRTERSSISRATAIDQASFSRAAGGVAPRHGHSICNAAIRRPAIIDAVLYKLKESKLQGQIASEPDEKAMEVTSRVKSSQVVCICSQGHRITTVL